MVVPLAAGSIVFVTNIAFVAALAVRERLRIRGLFARYVPADVVRELVSSDDPIRLGGESREVTVLFSDIRGFTTLSEHVDPEEMVDQLNEYFAAMVEVIGASRGTLDKFLGDGLMAIFGAPGENPDHAEDACRCALEMQRRLEDVNAQRLERDLPPLHIGIGIHTGLAVVGNVGSPLFRVDFTAIGDTVNLASRLESSTKDLNAEIVVSGATAASARAAGLAVEPLGSVVVKGRDGVTEVFALTDAARAAAAG
jgi:adenylate cyclase